MARRRTPLTPAVEARIVALMRAGASAERIAERLAAEGTSLSRATIGRRMRELAGRVKDARAPAARASTTPSARPKPAPAAPALSSPPAVDPPLPPPDEIPEGADLDTLDRWLRTAERMGRKAEGEGDLGALAAAGRLSASLLEAKRKATPPERPDPNDNPDMRQLGAQVAARLHALIDSVDPEGS